MKTQDWLVIIGFILILVGSVVLVPEPVDLPKLIEVE